jgi:ketosteroid isomerase-like protein
MAGSGSRDFSAVRRWGAAAIAFSLGVSQPALALAPEGPEAVITRYDAAWSARDEAALQGLIGPRYVYFTSRGGEWSRDRWFAFMLSPAYVLGAAERSEIRVVESGDTAVASTRWIGHGTFEGRPFDDDQRCSITLGRRDGAWSILSEHCTQITNGPRT